MMSAEPLVVHGTFVRRRLAAPPAVGAVWLLHAFADSSLAYRELLESNLGDDFDLYAPDFPGFGVSPVRPGRTSLADVAEVLVELIEDLAPSGQVFLVAHSAASIIATTVTRAIPERVAAVFSVEGNLTAADAYYTGQVARYASGEAFKAAFLEQVFDLAREDGAFRRYFAGVSFADPEALMGWGRSALEMSDAAGDDFISLDCPKVYYWRSQDPPEETRRFIRSSELPTLTYPGSGHWPMVDHPRRCAEDIGRFLRGVSE